MKERWAELQAESIAQLNIDLPELMATHEGEWVAYSGNRLIGFATSWVGIIGLCTEAGLTQDEMYVAPLGTDGRNGTCSNTRSTGTDERMLSGSRHKERTVFLIRNASMLPVDTRLSPGTTQPLFREGSCIVEAALVPAGGASPVTGWFPAMIDNGTSGSLLLSRHLFTSWVAPGLVGFPQLSVTAI